MNNYHNDTLIQRIKYLYDGNANNIEINSYNYDGSLYNKVKNIFEKNKIIESRTYTADGKLDMVFKDKFDDNGNLIENKIINSSGNLTNLNKYKYDKENNKIEAFVFRNDDLFDKKQKTYKYKYTRFDSNRNWIEKIEFIDDLPTKIYTRDIKYY
jgi:hypothetical protein